MNDDNFDLIIICGPPASGKMTVGQALKAMTGYKLFYNHMSLDLVNHFFDFGTSDFEALDKIIRFDVFKAIADSNIRGLIFTMACAFNMQEDEDYIDEIIALFKNRKPNLCLVDLSCDLNERLRRNKTANRLEHKVSKRDLDFSEKLLLAEDKLYRMNSIPGDFPNKKIIKIENTNKSAEEVAALIFERYVTKLVGNHGKGP